MQLHVWLIRIQRESGPKRRDHCLLAPQRVEDRGVKVMQPASRRVALERLRTRLLSLRHLPALSQQYGQVLVGRNVIGRKGDDSACSGYRFLELSLPKERNEAA